MFGCQSKLTLSKTLKVKELKKLLTKFISRLKSALKFNNALLAGRDFLNIKMIDTQLDTPDLGL